MAEWWEIEPSSCDAAVLHASTFPVRAAGDIVDRLKPGANVAVLGTLDDSGTLLHARATAVLEDAGLEIRDCGVVITADGLLSVLLARKPLDGTVAANTLKHGVGGLNIDGCRIGIADGDEPVAGRRTANFGTQETVSGGNGSGGWEAATGRWPANLLLEHTPECRKTGAVAEVTGGGTAGTSGFAAGYEAGDGYDGRVVTSESWVCGDSCPVKELDEQGGIRAAGRAPENNNVGFGGVYTEGTARTGVKRDKAVNFGAGGPSRYYRADAGDLNRRVYLLRLIAPKNAVIIGFQDDGLTSEAAEAAGMQVKIVG
jgi:site-specific DNA-methyltransferase (adenine-specific)